MLSDCEEKKETFYRLKKTESLKVQKVAFFQRG